MPYQISGTGYCKQCGVLLEKRNYSYERRYGRPLQTICKHCLRPSKSCKVVYSTPGQQRKASRNAVRIRAHLECLRRPKKTDRKRNMYTRGKPWRRHIKGRITAKNHKKRLSTRYMIRLLTDGGRVDIEVSDIPMDIIILKRKQLKLYRHVKQQNNINNTNI